VPLLLLLVERTDRVMFTRIAQQEGTHILVVGDGPGAMRRQFRPAQGLCDNPEVSERLEEVEQAVLTATVDESRWIPSDETWKASQIGAAVELYVTTNQIKDIEVEVVPQVGVRVKRVSAT
jgi:hypothetical protein